MIVLKSVIVALTVALAIFATGQGDSSTVLADQSVPDTVKQEIEQGGSVVEEELAKPNEGNVLTRAKEKIGPLASDITNSVKEKISSGLQAVQDVFTQIKETVTSNVTPFVENILGMFNSVRAGQDKGNQTKINSGEVPMNEDAVGFPKRPVEMANEP